MPSNRALDLIAGEVPQGSVIIEGGAALYMEVTDTSDMSQWMYVSPATQADYDGLVVSSPLRKTGIAKASMDCAAFVTSPDQSQVAERTIEEGLTLYRGSLAVGAVVAGLLAAVAVWAMHRAMKTTFMFTVRKLAGTA